MTVQAAIVLLVASQLLIVCALLAVYSVVRENRDNIGYRNKELSATLDYLSQYEDYVDHMDRWEDEDDDWLRPR